MTQVQTVQEGKVYKVIPITVPAFEILGTGSVDLYTSLANNEPESSGDLKTSSDYTNLTQGDHIFKAVPKYLKFEENASGSRIINFTGIKLEDINFTAAEFTMTVDTTDVGGGSANDQFAVPFTGTTNVEIFYKNQLIKQSVSQFDNLIQFSDGGGVKELVIKGDFAFNCTSATDRTKLRNISAMGSTFRIQNTTFLNASHLTVTATDKPNQATDTSMSSLFGSTSITTVPNLDKINTKFNTSYSSTFSNTPFNQSINNLVYSLVTSISSMLAGCNQFNQEIDISLPLCTSAGNAMFQCSNQRKNITWRNTVNLANFAGAFANIGNLDGIATITIEDFSAATNLSSLLLNTKLSTANIDQFLSQWVATGILNLTVDIGSSVPSAAGLADVAILQGRGWTITNIGS